MSRKLKERPADEVLLEIAELDRVEQRKADKEPRKRVSDHEAAVAALFHVWGCTIEEQETLRAIINETKGSAPDEFVKVSESAAGRLLGGGDGITDASSARRFKRRWLEGIERDLQAKIKKRVGERKPGMLVFKGDAAIPKCAEYRVVFTQSICDIIRLANLARGKRRTARFRDAALAVHAELPDYKPTLTVVEPTNKVKMDAPKKGRAGGSTRAMTRFQRDVSDLVEAEKEKGAPALATQYSRMQAKVAELTLPAMVETDPQAAGEALHTEFIENAKLQLELARKQGPEAVEALQTRLFSDLGTLFADPEAPEEETEMEGVVKQKLMHTNFSENLQNPKQNQISGSQALDTGVQSSASLRAMPMPAVKQDTGTSPPPARPDLVYEKEVFD